MRARAREGGSETLANSGQLFVRSQALRRSLIYKDEHIIALNKPYDLAVQGGSKV